MCVVSINVPEEISALDIYKDKKVSLGYCAKKLGRTLTEDEMKEFELL